MFELGTNYYWSYSYSYLSGRGWHYKRMVSVDGINFQWYGVWIKDDVWEGFTR